jgi:hypothetical protein
MIMETDIDNEITHKVMALTEQDWSELEDLYSRLISHKGSFSEMGGGKEIEPNVIEMPYTIEKPIVSEVRKFLLDKNLIVMFDWSHWDEGRAMFKVEEGHRFKDISLVDIIKLFIAVMRNDRFCDGAWADLFENGDGQRLFNRFLEFKPTNP